MLQKKALSPFELVMRNLPHCNLDEKVAVAKYLALQCGVQMYTPGDAAKLIAAGVQAELKKQRILLPR